MAVAEKVEVPPSLYTKLSQITLAVGGVAKDGRNDFHKYDYTTAEALLRAIRGPLAERHIALIPSVMDIAEREIRTAKGGVSTITTVRVKFTLADGDSDATVECEWAGQGDDPGDKGLGKAYTNAIKTFLRETFLIPQGDDPEADPKADERASSRVAAESKPPQANGAPLAEDLRERVLRAIAEKEQSVPLTLAAVGLEKPEQMTADHARQIKSLLDRIA